MSAFSAVAGWLCSRVKIEMCSSQAWLSRGEGGTNVAGGGPDVQAAFSDLLMAFGMAHALTTLSWYDGSFACQAEIVQTIEAQARLHRPAVGAM